MIIKGRKIGVGEPPYVVAEISANHNGELSKAFALIESAKNAGADAVKLQTYTPDTITLKCNSDEFRINNGPWGGLSLYELYNEAHTPWDWHKPLFDFARQLDITLFSTPFDYTAVDLLEELDTPAYKISSFEIPDLPLIRYVAKTGKPMIISTGMATVIEIEEAIKAAMEAGCSELALLHCVSSYPAPSSDYNLKTIQDMSERFGVVTGLSDHTIGPTTAITAVALGATIVEKHFTLNRNGGSPDDSFSIDPYELGNLCDSLREAWNSLGCVSYGIKSSEHESYKFRRSLYYLCDMNAGDTLTKECIKSVRPGYGLGPKYIDIILGKKLRVPVGTNTPVKMSDFEIGN